MSSAQHVETTQRVPDSHILVLHEALVRCGLADSLDALLGGIDRSLVAGLPWEARPNTRLLRVLHELNQIGELSSGGAPLETLVHNAVALTKSRPEEAMLRGIIETMNLPLGPSSRPGVEKSPDGGAPSPGQGIKLGRSRPLLLGLTLLLGIGAATIGLFFVVPAFSSSEDGGPSPSAPPITTVQVIDEPDPPPDASAPATRLLRPIAPAVPLPPRSAHPSSSAPSTDAVLPEGFDEAAANKGLSNASNSARQTCTKSDGPTGGATVAVAFGPAGRPTSVSVINSPFKGTPVGRCIETIFMRVTVPPYSGGSVSVSRSVVLGP